MLRQLTAIAVGRLSIVNVRIRGLRLIGRDGESLVYRGRVSSGSGHLTIVGLLPQSPPVFEADLERLRAVVEFTVASLRPLVIERLRIMPGQITARVRKIRASPARIGGGRPDFYGALLLGRNVTSIVASSGELSGRLELTAERALIRGLQMEFVRGNFRADVESQSSLVFAYDLGTLSLTPYSGVLVVVQGMSPQGAYAWRIRDSRATVHDVSFDGLRFAAMTLSVSRGAATAVLEGAHLATTAVRSSNVQGDPSIAVRTLLAERLHGEAVITEDSASVPEVVGEGVQLRADAARVVDALNDAELTEAFVPLSSICADYVRTRDLRSVYRTLQELVDSGERHALIRFGLRSGILELRSTRSDAIAAGSGVEDVVFSTLEFDNLPGGCSLGLAQRLLSVPILGAPTLETRFLLGDAIHPAFGKPFNWYEVGILNPKDASLWSGVLLATGVGQTGHAYLSDFESSDPFGLELPVARCVLMSDQGLRDDLSLQRAQWMPCGISQAASVGHE